MFFLNDNDEYLEVELGPWGQHLLLLLKGERNAIKHSMPLDYIAELPTDEDVSQSSIVHDRVLVCVCDHNAMTR